MRLAFVYDALYPFVNGGAERRFGEIGRRLADAHDVHFVSWQWWDGPSTVQKDGVTLHGVGRAPTLYGDDGKRTVREAVAFSGRLLPTLLRERFDVIDCSATPYVPLAAAAAGARLSGARLVATWHEFWGEHWSTYLPHRRGVARVARGLESRGRRWGDRVVAVSPFTARAMGMTDDPRLEIVPNGVDADALAPLPDARRDIDILFVGRLIDDKRIDILLDAVARLGASHPTLEVRIVGDGPERTLLEARAAALGLASRVTFTGSVPNDDVVEALRTAKVLAMPSIREGYGMVVAEAQAAGAVPVVVRAPASAAADLIRDGIDGFVVDPTADALADGIGRVLSDPHVRAGLSASARAVGAERDWAVVAGQMADVYTRLLEPQPQVGERRVRWS